MSRQQQYASAETYTQQTQHICITFVQCRSNVEDVGPTLYKCYTIVCVCWDTREDLQLRSGLTQYFSITKQAQQDMHNLAIWN